MMLNTQEYTFNEKKDKKEHITMKRAETKRINTNRNNQVYQLNQLFT